MTDKQQIEKIHQEVAVDLVRTIFETIDWSKDKTIFENGILELISEYCIDLKIKERVRKETAKEIINKIKRKYGKSCSEYYPLLIEITSEELDDLAKQYGVEVE